MSRSSRFRDFRKYFLSVCITSLDLRCCQAGNHWRVTFRTTIVNLFHIRCLISFNGSIFVVPVFVMKKCRRKKTLSDTMAKNCNDGNTFPLDIWYLIAKYIRPEDVITFSTICRDAWCVVNTPSFWLNLYKRSVYQR